MQGAVGSSVRLLSSFLLKMDGHMRINIQNGGCQYDNSQQKDYKQKPVDNLCYHFPLLLNLLPPNVSFHLCCDVSEVLQYLLEQRLLLFWCHDGLQVVIETMHDGRNAGNIVRFHHVHVVFLGYVIMT